MLASGTKLVRLHTNHHVVLSSRSGPLRSAFRSFRCFCTLFGILQPRKGPLSRSKTRAFVLEWRRLEVRDAGRSGVFQLVSWPWIQPIPSVSNPKDSPFEAGTIGRSFPSEWREARRQRVGSLDGSRIPATHVIDREIGRTEGLEREAQRIALRNRGSKAPRRKGEHFPSDTSTIPWEKDPPRGTRRPKSRDWYKVVLPPEKGEEGGSPPLLHERTVKNQWKGGKTLGNGEGCFPPKPSLGTGMIEGSI